MSKVRIYGDTSGYVDIAVPAVAGTTTLNLDKIPQADITTGNIAMDTDTLFVDATNNRVGLGTSSPLSALHVTGAIDGSPAVAGFHAGMSGNYAAIEMSGTDGGFIDFQDATDGSDHSGRIIYAHSDDSMIFSTAGAQRLTIGGGGNVGIGTTSPAGLLSLAKGTRTLDLKLETSPPTNDMGIQFRTGPGDYIGIAGPTGIGLCVDTNNQVGIGIGDPIKAPLDVKGSGTLGYPANGVDLPAGRRINLYDVNQDHMIGMGNDGMFFTGNTAIRFQYKSGTNAANGTNQLTVDMLNGRIGVGISTPSAVIEAKASTATNTSSAASIGGGSINTTNGDTVTGRIFWTGASGSGTEIYGVNNETNGLTIYNYTDNKYRIYFKNDGYTGIGTNNPSGAFDVEWSANTPANGIYLKNTNTGSNAFTGTYYGNTSSDTDAFVGLLGTNNPSYAGARSFLLGTNSSAAVAIMVGGTQVHTVAQAPSTSADGYSLTTPALTQTNQLYNMSGTILWDTINNNGKYQPMDYANAIKRYANIGSPTFLGVATSFHNSHSGSVFNTTWCANRELFDMRAGVHYWRVPKSGTYTLTARGAGYNHSGGNGRSLTMDYVLYAGEWLRGVCGAQGEGGSGHCGGCGATAISVYRQGIHIPILIAGGGAGVTPNSPGGTSTRRDATPPTIYGTHNPQLASHYGARDGMGGHGSIYQHNYGSYIVNWGGGGGGGWATPGGNGGIGINMQEQQSGGAPLGSDCPRGGYYQAGNAYHGGFGGGGASGVSSGAAGGGGGWYGGNSSYATTGSTSDDTDYMGGGSYAAGTHTDNGAHQSYGQILIQI